MSKPAVRQKPKPPPYPRPVPQFVVEELPPKQEDFPWSVSNGGNHFSEDEDFSVAEAAAEQRAAKRRRIEACATAYLRGEPLYIMSAQLKGPFNDGWKNPWAKKRKSRAGGDLGGLPLTEVPETTGKISSSTGEPRVAPMLATTPEPRPTSRGAPQNRINEGPMIVQQAPSPFTSKRHKLPDGPSPQVPRQVKERRVEEWLRTNDAFAKRGEILVHSSPTPSSRPRKTLTMSRDKSEHHYASQSEPPGGLSPKISPTGTALSLQPRSSQRLSRAQRRVQQLSRNIQNIVTEPPARPSNELQDEVRRLAYPTSRSKSPDTARAEFAILEAKLNRLGTKPANAHLSPIEFKKTPRYENKQPAKQHLSENTGLEKRERGPDIVEGGEDSIAAIDLGISTKDKPLKPQATKSLEHGAEALEQHTAAAAQQSEAIHPAEHAEVSENDPNAVSSGKIICQEEEAPIDKSSRRVLSTAVSEMSTLEMLPSAQPVLERLLSASSTTHDKLVSIKPIISASDDVAGAQNGAACNESAREHTKDTENATWSECRNLVEAHGETPRDEVEAMTTKPNHEPTDFNIQDKVVEPNPSDLSSMKNSKQDTSKKAPTTIAKKQADKKRKKTSFAVDPASASSHGSIRDAMKARVSKSLGSPPLFLFTKDDLDMEVSDEENGRQHKRSRRLSNTRKSKSVLKSTNQASPPISTRRSKTLFSTGQEHDGQQQNNVLNRSGQNAGETDNFDLDAAIDDLGSFLGTWDAEKEASSLDVSL